MSQMNQITDYLAKNIKLVLAVVATFLVIVAIAGVWSEMRAKKEREATNLLYEAQTKAHVLVATKKYDEAEQAYSSLLQKYSGSRAAFEAELQIGDLWMDAGAYDKAVEHYQKAAEITKDKFSQIMAKYSLGIAWESAGKYQEAVTSYDDALLTKGSDFLQPELLMAKARCHEQLNQFAKAIEVYKNVQSKFATKTYYSGAASAFEKLLSAKVNP